jgi:hypothetical protein
MSNVLDFEFEELPLVVTTTNNGADRVEAGLTNGMADVEYTTDGEWWITGVSIEGHQKLTLSERAAGKKPWVYVKAPVELEDMICHRLENEWRDRVQEAIRETLAADREDHYDFRRDARRDHLMEV